MATVISSNRWNLVRNKSGSISADSVPAAPAPARLADIPATDQFYLSGSKGIWVYWAGSSLSAGDTADLAVYLYNGDDDAYAPVIEQVKGAVSPYSAVYFDLKRGDVGAVIVTSFSTTGSPTDLKIWACGGE